MARKGLSDVQVCRAYEAYRENLGGSGVFPQHLLQLWTRESEKVCLAAMERAVDRGLVEYGVSLQCGFLTEEGKKLLDQYLIRHKLRTDPDVFRETLKGRKTFEIRLDDRGFKEGDELILMESVFPAAKTKQGFPYVASGRRIRLRVTYILRGPVYGLKDGWVIMSTEKI